MWYNIYVSLREQKLVEKKFNKTLDKSPKLWYNILVNEGSDLTTRKR